MADRIEFQQLDLIEHKNLHRELKVTLPASLITEKVDQEVQKIRKKARISGYRAGKVPAREIERRYGEGIREQVFGDFVQKSFEQAIQEKKIKLAGQPELEFESKVLGEPLSYVVKFEIYPEIKLNALDELKLVEPKVKVEQEMIDEGIEKLRVEHRNWELTKKKAAQGHQLVIDFEGMIDGELFEGGKAENFEFIIGEGRMLEAFEKPILGHCAGDEISASVTFPEDYHAKELQGKEATFQIKLHQVAEGILPEVNEEFMKKMGIESGNIEDLNAQVSETLLADLSVKIRGIKYMRACEALVKKYKVDLPEVMLKDQMEDALKTFNEKEESSLTMEELSRSQKKKIEKQAAFKTAGSLLLFAIIDEFGIQLDEKRLMAHIRSLALPYVDESRFLSWFFSDQNRVESAKMQVLEEQAVEKVFELAQTKSKDIKYHDVDKILNKELASYE